MTTNAAAYQFAELTNLKELRARLRDLCHAIDLRGTILLSAEGINLFIAGETEAVETLLAEVRRIPGLGSLQAKFSTSDRPPFRRMLVRIKREIIAFGVPGVDPARNPAPRVTARELKQWLDEQRPITLLDTRNDYEIKLGTFRGARAIGVQHFRQFPEAAAELPEEWKHAPVVTFCTGGIRCEKAAPYLQQIGFQNVFQLEGGILKYFEECGNEHYDGECFVFDARVGLDASLGETRSDVCFACLSPLTPDEMHDERFQRGVSCPYCFVSDAEHLARTLAARHTALRAATNPLPGSVPYDNYRPIDVPATAEGQPLLEFLTGTLRHVPREHWLALFANQQLLTSDRQPASADRLVHAGERYLHWEPTKLEPDVNVEIQIVFEDEAVVVVHKPAPLPVHASGQFNRNTLTYVLRQVYRPQRPQAAHRLDANTSGLMVFARTRHIAGLIQPQFARGEVEKVYLARVLGQPAAEKFRCNAAISAAAGETGSRVVDDLGGLAAETEFQVLRRLDDGTTLVEARPITGRTNQIRVHLWELGWPICGEQLYLPGKKLGDVQTVAVGDPPLCLLAYRLTFTHPLSGERRSFTAELPGWASGEIRCNARGAE